MSLSLSIGIDFTSSNGDFRKSGTNHYLNPDYNVHTNPYQQVMQAFSETFIDLAESDKIKLNGFGAILNFPTLTTEEVSYSFPCTGKRGIDQDLVEGIEGVFDTYSTALRHIEMSGPTYFSPLFSKILADMERTKELSLEKYMVFLVMTDGMFYDMQETIDLLVAACYKPISIIIIGIGQQDFESYYHLASLECKDRLGKKPVRHICRFIHYE